LCTLFPFFFYCSATPRDLPPFPTRRSSDLGLDGDRERLHLGQGGDDGFTGGEGHVDQRLTTLQGLLDGVQRAHFGALVGGDGEDRPIVLGRRNLQAGVDAVLRDVEVTAGRVQVLQRNDGADVRVDAVSHFGCPLSSTCPTP